jgi:hypothetical protein
LNPFAGPNAARAKTAHWLLVDQLLEGSFRQSIDLTKVFCTIEINVITDIRESCWMRRSEKWFLLADELKMRRSTVHTVCSLLNQRWRIKDIAEALGYPTGLVIAIMRAARAKGVIKPLPRAPRAATVTNITGGAEA